MGVEMTIRHPYVGRMRLLLVFMEPLFASLKIGRMVGWTHSRQEGWRPHLLKCLHRPLIY